MYSHPTQSNWYTPIYTTNPSIGQLSFLNFGQPSHENFEQPLYQSNKPELSIRTEENLTIQPEENLTIQPETSTDDKFQYVCIMTIICSIGLVILLFFLVK